MSEVAANRQVDRILCSIDLFSHTVRPETLMFMQKCRFKPPQTTSYKIIIFFPRNFQWSHSALDVICPWQATKSC